MSKLLGGFSQTVIHLSPPPPVLLLSTSEPFPPPTHPLRSKKEKKKNVRCERVLLFWSPQPRVSIVVRRALLKTADPFFFFSSVSLKRG